MSCEIEDEPTHYCPEPKKLPPRAGGYVLNKRARLLPVPEADARGARHASKINDQSKDNQKDDEQDFEQCEPEFDFTVDTDRRESHCDCKNYRDDDPNGRVDVRPVLEQHADGADFCWDGQEVAVDEVVAAFPVSILKIHSGCMSSPTQSRTPVQDRRGILHAAQRIQ